MYVIIAAGIGLVIGSFLNVVIHRIPAGASLLRPASACPNCSAALHWYENIPVVSWAILGGRCGHCRAPISIRYPIIEILTGLSFAAVTWWRAPALGQSSGSALAAEALLLIALLWFAAAGIALAAIDLDVQLLPNRIVVPSLIVIALLLTGGAALSGEWARLLTAALAAAALFGFYLLLALIYPAGMGFGDVKLAAVIGLVLGWFGWAAVIVGAFAAFLIGGLVVAVMAVLRRARKGTAIPFGPMMLAGAWCGLLWGQHVLAWYLDLFGVQYA